MLYSRCPQCMKVFYFNNGVLICIDVMFNTLSLNLMLPTEEKKNRLTSQFFLFSSLLLTLSKKKILLCFRHNTTCRIPFYFFYAFDMVKLNEYNIFDMLLVDMVISAIIGGVIIIDFFYSKCKRRIKLMQIFL